MEIIDEAYVNVIIKNSQVFRFNDIVGIIHSQFNERILTKDEKNVIAISLQKLSVTKAEVFRITDSIYGKDNNTICDKILIVTAYSSDYILGTICESINRMYATKHNYEFYSKVLSLAEISAIISPKKHCAWYKIWLIKKLFLNKQDLYRRNIQYIMWIDADAIIINHNQPLSDIISLGKERDLIIAEDMNIGCFINSGIFLIRTTHWSELLINDVWNCNRYDSVTYYEQSTMVKCLKRRLERLEMIKPFHSYTKGGYQGPKVFAHTTVLPLHTLNTNRGITCCDVDRYQQYQSTLTMINTINNNNNNSSNVNSNYNGIASEECNNNVCKYYLSNGKYCDICKRGDEFRPSGTFQNHINATTNSISNNDCSYQNTSSSSSSSNSSSNKLFAYHPAGMIDKLILLQTAIWKYNINIQTYIQPILRSNNNNSMINTSQNNDNNDNDKTDVDNNNISSVLICDSQPALSLLVLQSQPLLLQPHSQQPQQEFKLIRRSHGKIPTLDYPQIYHKLVTQTTTITTTTNITVDK